MSKYDANKLKPVPTSPTRLSLRDQLKSRSASAIRTQLVSIDFKDGSDPMEVECVSLKSGKKWEIQNAGFREIPGDEGKVHSVVNANEFYPRLIAAAYRDPVSKEPLWLETELDDIRELPPDIAGQFSGPALELNGWAADKEDAEDAAKAIRGNSDQAATEGSSGMSQIEPTSTSE